MHRTRFTLALALGGLLISLCPALGHAQDSPAAPPAAAASRHPEHFTLANGLEVVLEEDHRAPRVAVVVKYRVGQADDPQGYHGLAHLVEHLMYSGYRVPETNADFLGQLESAGATQFNAATTAHFTEYHEVVPAEQLELALWMESGRMAYLLGQLNDDVIERQRRVVTDEERERAERLPSSAMAREIEAALYPVGHPYHSVSIVGNDDIDAVSLPTVQWFFQTHYGPENAVLVLVGDFHSADAHALVDQYFAPVVRSNPPGESHRSPAPAPAPAIPPVVATTVTAAVPTRLEMLEVRWPSPAYFAPGDADLDVLAYILAERVSSRLDRALVATGAAIRVSAEQSSELQASTFDVEIIAAPTHRATELLRAFEPVIERLRTEPVSEVELRGAQRYWQFHILSRSESLLDRALELGTYLTHTGDADYLARNLARYSATTADSVLQAARTYLDPAHRVVGLLTRDLHAPRDGRVVSVVRAGGNH